MSTKELRWPSHEDRMSLSETHHITVGDVRGVPFVLLPREGRWQWDAAKSWEEIFRALDAGPETEAAGRVRAFFTAYRLLNGEIERNPR